MFSTGEVVSMTRRNTRLLVLLILDKGDIRRIGGRVSDRSFCILKTYLLFIKVGTQITWLILTWVSVIICGVKDRNVKCSFLFLMVSV